MYVSGSGENPQTLLFSATLPSWVHDTARKYMNKDKLAKVTLVNSQENRTSTTVQVRHRCRVQVNYRYVSGVR